MAEILTSKGESILVDDADYEMLAQHTWWLNSGGYAITSIGARTVLMASLLLDCPAGMMRDHRNRNRRDNRRHNLRVATPLESQGNTGVRKDNRSGFKGVTWNKAVAKWKAQIREGGRRRFLGYHVTAEAAARAYDAAARALFGEFAFLNFPVS